MLTGTAAAQADLDARRAGIQRLRLTLDPVWRERYREYLRGRMPWREVFAGVETHEEWYTRTHEGEK